MSPDPLVAALPAPHGFFTRAGGVSTGAYASLNCSLSGQDHPDAVHENRARAARALGADPTRLLGLSQVHGSLCITVHEPWPPGAGPRADAMVTARGDLALAIVTADCAPVLFIDPGRRIVGAAHAGWRGAASGILEATILAMTELGASRERIAAAVGPCIQAASYEVTAELRDAVSSACAADAALFTPGRDHAHWQFDLPGYCLARLTRAGLREIAIIPADTCAEPDRFFSHRRRTLAGGGAIGHQISVIRCPT